jgi:hypothetical protein
MPTDHDVKKLEKMVTDLSDLLAHLGSSTDLKKLIEILRHPGWTTPAEFIFAHGILVSMLANAQALTQLKNDFVKGSQAVIAKR